MTPIRALPGHRWMLPLFVHDDHSPELSGLLSLQRTIRNYAERQWEGPADPDGCMTDPFGTQALEGTGVGSALSRQLMMTRG